MSDGKDTGADALRGLLDGTGFDPAAIEDLIGEMILGDRYVAVRESRLIGENVRDQRSILETVLDDMIQVSLTDMRPLSQEARVGLFAGALAVAMREQPGKIQGILSVFGLAIERLAALPRGQQIIAKSRSIELATPEGQPLRVVGHDHAE